ncbi:MAG: type 3 dihydrofolate reductase [Arenicellales bacterium]
MEISLVVAMDENRLIGAGNALPWHLPADLKHFKKTTMGHPIVMGRCTWESIGRALPGRTNIVVSRRPGYRAEGAVVVNSIEAAREAARASAAKPAGDLGELMVIGGAVIFEQCLAEATRIYLTEIHAAFEGDTYFPELSQDEWACVSREDFRADDKNQYDYSFMVLERIPNALPPTLIQPAL